MKNIDKVNLIKREEVATLLSNPEIVKYFESIKIFGSCVSDRCTEKSDIDLFCSLKPEYQNDKGENDAYLALLLGSSSDKDIFFAHQQSGKWNPKLYENMKNGVEVLL